MEEREVMRREVGTVEVRTEGVVEESLEENTTEKMAVTGKMDIEVIEMAVGVGEIAEVVGMGVGTIEMANTGKILIGIMMKGQK
jgi:hypothetical protein